MLNRNWVQSFLCSVTIGIVSIYGFPQIGLQPFDIVSDLANMTTPNFEMPSIPINNSSNWGNTTIPGISNIGLPEVPDFRNTTVPGVGDISNIEIGNINTANFTNIANGTIPRVDVPNLDISNINIGNITDIGNSSISNINIGGVEMPAGSFGNLTEGGAGMQQTFEQYWTTTTTTTTNDYSDE